MFLKSLRVALLAVAAIVPKEVVCEQQNYRTVVTAARSTGTQAIPADITTPDGSTFGGISSLAYDESRDIYYGISGYVPASETSFAGSSIYNPRYYKMIISNSSFEITDVVYLKDEAGTNFELGVFQPTGIAYGDNALYISHEEGTVFSSGVWVYNLNGVKITEFILPSSINSAALHSITVPPFGDRFFVASEDGLEIDDPNLIRITEYKFNQISKSPTAQYIYQTQSYLNVSNRLLDLVALDDNGSFLTLESDGSMWYAFLNDASNVVRFTNLTGANPQFARKTFIAGFGGADFQAIGIEFQPRNESVYNFVLMSNNNFNKATQLLNGELRVDTSIGVVLPFDETEREVGNAIARDPSVWVNKDDVNSSLVIGALMDGGIGVYNLTGHLLEKKSGNFLSTDIIYAFNMNNGDLIDVVVATRGAIKGQINATAGNYLSIFRIGPDAEHLTEITGGVITTGFTDIVNGTRIVGPALNVATYVSPYTGKIYAFVTRGLQVAQIELHNNGNGTIGSTGDDRIIDVGRQVAGIVVDREMGILYISLAADQTIIKIDAEPNERDGDIFFQVANAKTPGKTFQGLTMYYSGYRKGYLILSVAGDSSFTVFEREGNNQFVGSFTIGETEEVDRTVATQEIDVININLGPDFACGAFLAQDNDSGSTYITNQRNTNFKLVPFEHISDAMREHLSIDTDSWGPRRFALASLVDSLSISIYSALKRDEISGRDAAAVLDFLAQAANHLYPPATKKRQMMEPYFFVRGLQGRSSDSDSDSSSSHSRRHRHQKERRVASICSETTTYPRYGSNTRARQELRQFIDVMRDLRRTGRLFEVSLSTFNYWTNLASHIIQNVPAELEYYHTY